MDTKMPSDMTDTCEGLRKHLSDINLAISHLGQIFGLIEAGKIDEASDYCRCAADSWTQDIARIDALLANGGWIKVSGKDGAMRDATFIDSRLLKLHIATERNGEWYARQPLPPLPKD